MPSSPSDSLLSRLAGRDHPPDGSSPWDSIAASEPEHDAPERDEKLDALLSRIQKLSGSDTAKEAGEAAAGPSGGASGGNDFLPMEPSSLSDTDLSESEIEALILKYLLARGDASGRDIGEQVKLPFVLVDELLRRMKNEQLIGHRGSAPMNDYQYQLSDMGRERGRRYSQHCTYFGAAPVSLQDYIAAVEAQSLAGQHPTAEDLHRAFEDLLLNKKMLDRLGPAINSGRGLFLFGPPGNGKTCIAERITAAFGELVWIPRAMGIDGEIIRLFDPVNLIEVPLESDGGLLDKRKIDRRWVRIKRPTIVAGGELTMSQLEVTINTSTGISEAPLQLKSNCGTLVIDDFGRQRMSVDELLNRWIVPLEMRYDFLNLPNGKKIRVPFDQLVVFSTNLEPRDLVDEAFLRRIPYKIEAIDPSEQEFRDLFKLMAGKLGIDYDDDALDHLLQSHYRKSNRPLRFCHPHDLLLQIRNYCTYCGVPPRMTPEYLDRAVENYFSVM
ncbi:MAG: AAA family ATPase [Patescibacteria group bacterium]|nr:AAA family ATPase [Patescibacteria group bacterium]